MADPAESGSASGGVEVEVEMAQPEEQREQQGQRQDSSMNGVVDGLASTSAGHPNPDPSQQNHGQEEPANGGEVETESAEIIVESASGHAIPAPQASSFNKKDKPYQARERIRRIHLPVREGMDEISDDEGDGSQWAYPTEEEKKNLPPGFTGKRRIKDPNDKKIKPAYYYPTDSSARGVPVFEPSYEDFRDFNSFIAQIDNYGMKSGIVKVVPPKQWLDSAQNIDQPLKDTLIKDAIEQHFMGSRGQFRQSNISSRRAYSVKQWKEMCESEKYQTPNFFEVQDEAGHVDGATIIAGGRTTRSGRVARQAATPTAAATPASSTAGSATKNTKRGRPSKKQAKAESVAPAMSSPAPSIDNKEEQGIPEATTVGDVDMETLQNPEAHEEWEKKLDAANDATAAILSSMAVDGAKSATPAVKEEGDDAENVVTRHNGSTPPPQTLPPSTPAMTDTNMSESIPSSVPRPQPINTQATPVAAAMHGMAATPTSASSTAPAQGNKRKTMGETQADRDREWENFDYRALPWGAKPSDYTVDECKKIEKMYWQRFSLGEPPMYGADGSGSLFDDSVKDWNVASLDDLLMRVNPHVPMPGVNTPYLYFGMWRATFAWHVEDADLYSINYLHFGAPKFWYSVPQEHAERFERVIAGYFPRDQQKCPEFMRHKSFLVSPTNLAKDGIPLNRCVQFPGEIVLTYPYGYHSGFNIGFNCAESINFATEAWLDIGRRARACVCQPDTVRIDVDSWLQEAREDAERMRSDPAYATYRQQQKEYFSVVPQHEAKRRRLLGPAYDQMKRSLQAPAERVQRTMQPLAPAPTATALAVNNANQKPLAPKASTSKSGKAPPNGQYPCALCPELSTEGLVKIAGLLKNNKQVYAHKICVTFTPTTWCAYDTPANDEFVYGYDQIEKERWNLKCGLCDNKHGTKIQCTKSAKCVRAFHATCAIKEDSGVVLDALIGGRSVLEPPKPGEAPVADGHLQLVVTCRQHNPEWQKIQAEKRRVELATKIESVPLGSSVQIRTTTGVWAVTLVNHKTAEEGMIEIQFGNGERAVCKHAAVVWPEDKVLQSSAAAGAAKPRARPTERAKPAAVAKPAPAARPTLQQVQQVLLNLTPEQQAGFHQWYVTQFLSRGMLGVQQSRPPPPPAMVEAKPPQITQQEAQARAQAAIRAANAYPSPVSLNDYRSPEAEQFAQAQALVLNVLGR